MRAALFLTIFCAALSSPAQEFRAAWADIFHVGLTSAADVDTMVSRLAAGHYNVVIAQVLGYMDNPVGSHGAHWKSNILPWSSRVTASFDPLAYLCQKAHANGIEVHAWLGGSSASMYRVSTAWPPVGNATLAAHPEWFIAPRANSEGNAVMAVDSVYALDMGSPDVQEYIVSIVKELVTNYPIDGINWDDEINGAGYTAGFGYPAYSQANYPRSGLARFRVNTGYVGTPLNTDTAWSDYRRRYKNELMARVQAEMQSIKTNPRQPLRHTSAALAYSPVPPSCDFTTSTPYTYYCDWAGMLQNGWLDAVVPQVYSQSTVSNWMDRCSACWQYNRQIFPGFGAYLTSNTGVGNNVKYARSKGLLGFATYSYAVPNSSTSTNWWDYSATNVCTNIVSTPPMPWRNPATATEGIVWGRLTDFTTGFPVDDAVVTVAGGPTVRSDGNGYYVATLVPATAGGTPHVITATKTGMISATANALALPGDVARYDLLLNVGSVLNTSVLPIGGGTIEKSPDQFGYTLGSIVTLTATAAPEYEFVGWSGDVTGTNNPAQLTINSNNNVVAHFLNHTELIVDNPDATYFGNWVIGTAAPGKFGDYYQYTASTTSFATSSTTYTPQIVAPGKYDVFIWYPPASNRTANAQVFINYNNSGVGISVDETSGGGDWQLLVPGLDFATGREGFVQISNDTGEANRVVIADAIRFSKVNAPIIVNSPKAQTVGAGKSASFSVLAAGTAALSYQWQRNGTDVPGATNGALHLSSAKGSDAGSYSVVVSNRIGTATSASALLIVIPPAAPQLSLASRLADGRFQFNVAGDSNVIYSVDISTNLVNWTPVTNILNSSGTINYTDPVTNLTHRFYRARWSP